MNTNTLQTAQSGSLHPICSLCLWCGKPGGNSIVKHPKTAGVEKGRYHAACLLKARKAKANAELSDSRPL